MRKWNWRECASLVGAGLIVVGLITWSALSNIHDVSKPWMPTLPEPEWLQIAIGAAGLVGLWWTVIFARRAWTESKRSADEAKRSADAAHEALADTRKGAAEQAVRFQKQLEVAVAANAEFSASSRRQIRAYLTVHEAMVLRAVETIARPEVTAGLFRAFIYVVFRNSGQSPAFAIRTSAVATLGTLDEFERLKLPDPDSETLAGAGGTFTSSALLGKFLSDQEVVEAVGNGKRIWIGGIVRYRDVFDVEWELCFRYATDKVAALRQPDPIAMSAIPESNYLRRLDGASM